MANFKSGKEKIDLRDYQKVCISKLNILNQNDKFSTLVSLPTGGGKTIIGVKFCLDRIKEGHKVLWLADRVNLLEQSIRKIEKYDCVGDISYQLICSNVSAKKNKADCTGKKIDDKKIHREKICKIDKDTQILFASVGSISAVTEKYCEAFDEWIKESQANNKKLYIIYDEAHHIGANEIQIFFRCLFTNQTNIAYSIKRFGMIGLTATVFRNDRYLDVFNAWFKDGFIGDNQVSITSPYGDEVLRNEDNERNNRIEVKTLSELVKEKYLVAPDIYKVDEFQNGMPEDEIEYLVDRISKYSSDWGKTIVFVKTRRQAMQLGMLLCDNKIPCFVYISNKNLDDDDVYKKFTSKDYETIRNDGAYGSRAEDEFHDSDCTRKIMITVDMVSEGYDIQDLNTIYLYSKIGSHIRIRQRIGRVMRSTEDSTKGSTKEARVFWQKYPESEVEDVLKLKDVPDTFARLEVQNQAELDADVVEYYNNFKKNKSAQIPAAMYLEELPEGLCRANNYYSEYEFLQILSMFSTKDIENGLGFFYDRNKEILENQDDIIWVRRPEKEGYLQFFNMINNDYRYHLRFKDEYITDFQGYANALGVSEDALLEDVKKICFYLSNTSQQDIAIKKSKRIIQVKDEEIIRFCNWVLMDVDLRLPAFDDKSIEETADETTNGTTDDGSDSIENTNFLAEYIKENIDEQEPPKTMEAAMKLIANMKSKRVREEHLHNKEKEYTDLLLYGDAQYIHQELMSARSLIQSGIVSQERVQGRLENKNVDLAFVGWDTEIQEVRHLNRKCINEIAGNDLLVLSNAIVNTINHIQIKELDVEDYNKKLLSKVAEIYGDSIMIPESEDDRTRLVGEFLMALGYAYNFKPHKDIAVNSDNDKLIRMQCKMFGDDLPNILRYVIYDRVYINLYRDVNYYDSNNQLKPVCQNEDALNNKYQMILEKYCVNTTLFESTGLNPVADVIYDYRPYFKAVQYYQGIKPEFLCRLVNDVFQLDRSADNEAFIDGFGGSGVCSMNTFYKNGANPVRVYNDFGDMNVAFYRCLQDEQKKQTLADMVEKTFNRAFEYARGCEENEEDKSFLKDIYGKYLHDLKTTDEYLKEDKENSFKYKVDSTIQYLEYGIEELETQYIIEDAERQKDTAQDKIDERLEILNDKYKVVLKAAEYDLNAEVFDIRRFEKYMHIIMLKIKRLYLVLQADAESEGLSDCDKAFVFLMNNNLSSRHIYNDCTIFLLAELYGNYQSYLDIGSECMSGVQLKRGDALKLMQSDEFNKATSKYYLDIPYAETDDATYVSKFFDQTEFAKRLSELKGTYLVSSRFNICVDSEKKQNALQIKKRNVFKFYSSFILEDAMKPYMEMLDTYIEPSDDEKSPEQKWFNITGNEAKYVLFPFTKSSFDYGVYEMLEENKQDKETPKDEKKRKPKNIFKKNTKLTMDEIYRMLAGTQLSNIPVEVMVTNADIDTEALVFREIDTDVWVIPTFKTGIDAGTYKAEPVIVVMKYQKYLESLLHTLAPDAWEAYISVRQAKDVAIEFKNIFNF